MRLDIRPRYCEVDPSLSVKTADGSTVPGFRVHEVDTGCEMRLGQTAVIGGQIQERIISRVSHDNPKEPQVLHNEVQTLFLVTPELVNELPSPPHSAGRRRSRNLSSADQVNSQPEPFPRGEQNLSSPRECWRADRRGSSSRSCRRRRRQTPWRRAASGTNPVD